LANQFANPANPRYHANTTAPEILSDFRGERLDYWVSGWGTGGTLSGAAPVLRAARPELKVIVAEPEVASLLQGNPWASHAIQGWTPDFIPEILDKTAYDKIVTVSNKDAITAAQALAAKEGIFCGISSGGTFAAALKVAAEAPQGSTILAMLPDTGERYLSTILFEGITEASDAE